MADVIQFPQRGRRVRPFLRVIDGGGRPGRRDVMPDFLVSAVGLAVCDQMDRLVEAGVLVRTTDPEGLPVYSRRMHDAG